MLPNAILNLYSSKVNNQVILPTVGKNAIPPNVAAMNGMSAS